MDSWSMIREIVAAEHRAFMQALHQPRQAQAQQLAAIIEANRGCEYGRQYGFAEIDSPEQYRRRVPITDYATLAPAIDRMLGGESAILCCQGPRCFELTGGSSAGSKKIPYNDAALAAIQRALYPWLMDLSTNRPGIMNGRSYWSISPALRAAEPSAGKIVLGMANDADYFGADLAGPLQRLLAAPFALAQCHELETWRYLTLRHLIACRDLSLISVWSPSFLVDLLDYLHANRRRFINDIKNGILSADLPASLRADVESRFGADPALAGRLQAAAGGERLAAERLWPRLDTVSCWTDASAALFVPELQQRLPGVHIQGKGLLATEAFVTLPLEGHVAPVLALRSGFFEFLDSDGRIRLGDELLPDRDYELLVTNHAGLYRYRLGDRVRCRGFAEATPLLSFVGRTGLVSDLCGEKLSEDFVLRQLNRTRGFAMLLPSIETPRAYLLILDAACWGSVEADEYALSIDAGLQQNPQYRHARRLGQLDAVRALRVDSPWRRYVDFRLAEGKLLGDIKPPVLSTDRSLADIFRSRPSIGPGVRA